MIIYKGAEGYGINSTTICQGNGPEGANMF